MQHGKIIIQEEEPLTISQSYIILH